MSSPVADTSRPAEPVLHVDGVVLAVRPEQAEEHRRPAAQPEALLLERLREVQLAARRPRSRRPPSAARRSRTPGRAARRRAGAGRASARSLDAPARRPAAKARLAVALLDQPAAHAPGEGLARAVAAHVHARAQAARARQLDPAHHLLHGVEAPDQHAAGGARWRAVGQLAGDALDRVERVAEPLVALALRTFAPLRTVTAYTPRPASRRSRSSSAAAGGSRARPRGASAPCARRRRGSISLQLGVRGARRAAARAGRSR